MPDWLYELIQALIDGLAIGSVYAMIALGYTLVYGIIKLINFAHGEFYMFGAYIGLFILTTPIANTSSVPLFIFILFIAMLGATIGGSLIAVLTEKIAYKPIRKYDRIVALLTAIGVSFFLQNLARLFFTPNPRSYRADPEKPQAVLDRFLEWYHGYTFPFDFELQNGKMLIMSITAVSMLLLYVLVMKTRMGKAMRATSQDEEAARLMGIDTDAIVSRTFALGGAFAGMTGMLVGMLYNVEPMMGFIPGLKAFVAAVVGGIGSIPGAVIGGLVIGLAENLAVFANLDTAYKDAVAFAILVFILLFKPSGILGVVRREKV